MDIIRTTENGIEHGSDAAAARLFCGDDETQELLRTVDWASTALGPVSTWPAELVAAVRTVLPSRLPMLLWWGPDLLQLYNDAFRVLLDSRHPAAIGQPAALCWAEVWDQLGPLVAGALAGSGSTYLEEQLLLLTRSERQEETYWTYSQSAIKDELGEIRGLLVTGNEVTAQVVMARRLATIRALSDISASAADSAADACAEAIGVLSRDRASVPFVAAFLTADDAGNTEADADGTTDGTTERNAVRGIGNDTNRATDGAGPEGAHLILTGSFGVAADAGSAVASMVRVEAERVTGTGVSEVVSGLADRVPPGTIAAGPLGPVIPDQAVIAPLRAGGQDPSTGVLVLGVSPYRPLDAGYRMLLELIAREVSVLVTDVQAYQAQRNLVTELADADRRQTEFYQNLSHELRTPLTLIQAPLHDVLVDEAVDLPPRHRAGMQAADRAAGQLRRLVDTLLQFSRVDAGVLHSDPEPTDLALLTAGLVSMFRSAADSNGLHLNADIAPLDQAVDIDRALWSTIVGNLLSNAIKFTVEGDVAVRLAVRDGNIQLTVTDTGPGIAESQLPLLFNRFHLVPSQSRHHGQGAGIGLALVADLVHAQQGEIVVQSTVGHGSTFTVSVPARSRSLAAAPVRKGDRPAEITTMVDELMRAANPSGIPTQRIGSAAELGHGGTILVVEDDEDMRVYLARLLADDGWQVEAVADVDQALAMTDVPDIVLADVMLPKRSGLELVRVIRATTALCEVPVVLLTGRAGPDRVAEGLTAGADDYVTKPFHTEELLARIHVHYELSKLRGYALLRANNDVANLRVAMTSNRRIGAAVGVLMASRRITEEDAFGLLREASQHANRKLREVAEAVILTGTLP